MATITIGPPGSNAQLQKIITWENSSLSLLCREVRLGTLGAPRCTIPSSFRALIKALRLHCEPVCFKTFKTKGYMKGNVREVLRLDDPLASFLFFPNFFDNCFYLFFLKTC